MRSEASALAALLLLVSAGACAPVTPTPSAPKTAGRTQPRKVRLTLRLPSQFPAAGVISTIPFSTAELQSGLQSDPTHVFTWLERLRGAVDVDNDPRTLTILVDEPTSPSFLQVYFDTGGHGLDTLFGPQPEVASALVQLSPGLAEVRAPMEAPQPKPRRGACEGPRLEKVVLHALELQRPGDDGTHELCVYLPSRYAQEPLRRYPVAYALPGFSGHAAMNDGFSARELFDVVGAEVGVDAILVGVETRIPEGTSYLATSARFGDWESYVINRVLPEIERRYRTETRRAVFGHSTGGWNALSIALRHPETFVAVGASSPDPLDLDVWLFDERGALRPQWRAWAVAEQALGGRGQFTSWAASWSPNDGAGPGYENLVDERGVVRPGVLARWRAASPYGLLETQAGKAAACQLSGRLFVTAGSADMFGLFPPTERFVNGLRGQGTEVEWVPTKLDHFGASHERFRPLVRFLLGRLGAAKH